MQGWQDAGYELFQDVNSYSKAFGELVEHRRHTPSLSAEDVQALIDEKADIAILDARRFEEYATMSIPTGTSVPGAELVLRASAVAPDPDTLIIVNCAGQWARQFGRLAGVNVPLYSAEHFYVVTDRIEGVHPLDTAGAPFADCANPPAAAASYREWSK